MSDAEKREESQQRSDVGLDAAHGDAKRVPLFLKIVYVAIPLWVIYYALSYHFPGVNVTAFKAACVIVLIAAIYFVFVAHVRSEPEGASQMNQNSSQAWSWILQRATAFLLIFGLIIHLWPQHYSSEKGMMFGVTFGRLMSPWWILFYLLFLAALIYHGLNGVWSIFLDYSKSLEMRKLIGWGILVLGILTYGFAVVAFAPFVLKAL